MKATTRAQIITAVVAALAIVTGCRRQAEAPVSRQEAEMSPKAEVKAQPAMRQHLKIGRWKMSADTATFSDDGRTVTFRGSVRFVTGSGDRIGIEEALDDPNSFAVFEVESGKLLEKSGRYEYTGTIGLAPK